jgi:hypothetical protein
LHPLVTLLDADSFGEADAKIEGGDEVAPGGKGRTMAASSADRARSILANLADDPAEICHLPVSVKVTEL